MTALDYKLYLAVSNAIYSAVFEQKAIQLIVQRYRLPIIVVDVSAEEIVAWKE